MSHFKDKYNVAIPDLDYYLHQIECRTGCPVETDGRGYMMALRKGDYEKGYRIARGPNPFASICGMICGAPCEMACRRTKLDKTLTIRAQKRFLDEWYGMDDQAHIKSLDYSFARGSTTPKSNGLKVACVGAGCASMTAAHDLLRLGYQVDLYEMMPLPGGMLVYGVPEYRLKNNIAISECHAIEHLGAKIYTNTKVGRDISLEDLEKKYDAVFIGNGLWKSKQIPLKGYEGPGIINGIEYLKKRCVRESHPIGKNVVIIGGGNVAFDCARTSMRSGASRVMMVCLESRSEQTADEFEIEDGIEEGVIIDNRHAPVEVVRNESNDVIGLKLRPVHRLFDHRGSFAPVFTGEPMQEIACDTIILAVGQEMDMSLFDGWSRTNELDVNRGIIVSQRGTGRTTVPGIYCGGDAGFGAALFINAVRHGQDAAIAIDTDLRQKKPFKMFMGEFSTVSAIRDKTYLKRSWQLPQLQPAEERTKSMTMVENNYTEKEAKEQADRCLQCHISPVFDGKLCIKCNGCVDVCPTNCLKLIPVDKLNLDFADGNVRNAVDHFFGIDSANMSDEDLSNMGSAMLKDEDLCIRCGLCAEKCPTEAVTMDVMNYSYRWID
jgi:formate dehydrogenase (NADP+) beta subunit